MIPGKLLAGKNYDPATRVLKPVDPRIAMTALDTTNLRLSFTAPASGKVWVRLGATWEIAGTSNGPVVSLGILDGATIRFRRAAHDGAALGTQLRVLEGLVTGLTPGNVYTWDMAHSVVIADAGANDGLQYGGPNNATSDDAAGAAIFEIWEVAQ